MNEYITTKTGFEDPFPDQIDPNEENLALGSHKSQKQQEEDERKLEEEEFQKLRGAVKIPYLPTI